MKKTIAFVTNQYACDRIVSAAKKVADKTETQLSVVGIMNSEYAIDPVVVDYLFTRSKEYGGSMRLIFQEDSIAVMEEIVSQYECEHIVTGMPSSNKSVLYDLWKKHPTKSFYTVAQDGEIVEVAIKASSVHVS